ncbi:hypothetical protein FHS16_002336 [Paenibacillus endophyticus]|uniref:DUF1885 family protein n=1 Tax=Paenibacillus endophyticus TaxID=1294268 RepID=A0A7W5GA16_9BACL|nr:DUF1885 family protein [Paenibacillus endophyticus]MBB3152290.1 hypothetical protein [Paenibacillus endophyticus]
MSQSAYIKFVQGSVVDKLDVAGIKNQLVHYCEQTALTGSQLDWNYAEAAFPYTIEEKQDDRWFYLKGINPLYKHILFGPSMAASVSGSVVPCIQVVVPDEATHGDKAKANELCKYIAGRLKAELTMFNGRTIYFNPRK